MRHTLFRTIPYALLTGSLGVIGAVIWLHLPLLALIAALLGQSSMVTGLIAVSLAGPATICWYLSPGSLEKG